MIDIAETILVILFFLPFIIITVAANLGEKSKTEREITYFLLAGLCSTVIIMGILVLTTHILIDMSDLEVNFKLNFTAMGAGMFITGIFSIILLFKDLRKIIAKFIPVNPDSVIHTTGLVLAFIVIGLSFTMMFSTNLIALEESPGEFRINEPDIIAQDFLFIVLALMSIGIFIRRSPKECIERLKLTIPAPKYILIGILAIPLFLAIDTIFGYIINYFNPDALSEIEKIMEMMLGTPTLLLALTASIGAGISEEILFRGAIQPRFGIPFTAFLFAVVHVQYSALWVIGELFVIGILLGILKNKTNTTTCIITHAGYDFVIFLLLIYA